MRCNLCPRQCNVDRSIDKGACGTNDNLIIARVGRHDYEEPPISGTKGSGTIFFGGCNLHCRYCQNEAISRGYGVEITPSQLCDCMLYLQDSGVHNINLVTPSHYANLIAECLAKVKSGLSIPVVYNTNSYEHVDSLRLLEGLVDIYLPDMKYYSNEWSSKLSQCKDYFAVASKAIEEMLRQQPTNVMDSDGIMSRGVIVRHLVLPTLKEDTKQVLDYLASVDSNITISIMSQYFAPHIDNEYDFLNRKVTAKQYNDILQYATNIGLVNVYMQELSSSSKEYVPNFDTDSVRQLLASLQRI